MSGRTTRQITAVPREQQTTQQVRTSPRRKITPHPTVQMTSINSGSASGTALNDLGSGRRGTSVNSGRGSDQKRGSSADAESFSRSSQKLKPAVIKITGTDLKAAQAIVAMNMGTTISESAGTINKKEQENKFQQLFYGTATMESELQAFRDGTKDRYKVLWDAGGRIDRLELQVIDGLPKDALCNAMKLSSTGLKAKPVTGARLKSLVTDIISNNHHLSIYSY